MSSQVVGDWVSGSFPPSSPGEYRAKFRSAKVKRHRFTWDGQNWYRANGDKILPVQREFFKWWSLEPRPY